MTVQVDHDMERAFAQLYEVQRRVLNGSLSPTMARRPLQEIIEGKFGDQSGEPGGLFTPPAQQVMNLLQWNRGYRWGLEESAICNMLTIAPEQPTSGLTAVVLVPYMQFTYDNTRFISRVECTFEALWCVAAARQQNAARWNGLKSDLKHLQPLENTDHPNNRLCWEVIDLGANCGVCSADVRDPDTSPHAGILAAAAHHPQWVQAMDGDTVPYVNLPGYQVTVYDKEPWRCVPALHRSVIHSGVSLSAYPADSSGLKYGVPVLLERRWI